MAATDSSDHWAPVDALLQVSIAISASVGGIARHICITQVLSVRQRDREVFPSQGGAKVRLMML